MYRTIRKVSFDQSRNREFVKRFASTACHDFHFYVLQHTLASSAQSIYDSQSDKVSIKVGSFVVNLSPREL